MLANDMKNQIALRYLLLHHVKLLEDKVSESTFMEVTESLQVKTDSNFYIIMWQIDGCQKTKKILKSEFQFYQRGDINPERRSINESLSTNNDAIAHSFAMEALSIKKIHQTQQKRGIEVNVTYSIIENVIFVLILILIGGIGHSSGLILFAILLAEYLHNGRLYSSILFIPFAFFSPGAALVGATVYAVLQFLDSNSVRRNLRITLNAGVPVIVFILESIGFVSPLRFSGYFLIAMLFAFFLAGYRSLFSFHYRAMPLTLPFISVGFSLENKIMATTIGLIFSVISIIRVAYWYKD